MPHILPVPVPRSSSAPLTRCAILKTQFPIPRFIFYGSMIRFIQQKIGSLHGVPLQYSWQVSEVTDAVTAAKNVMKDARTAFSQVAQKKKADRPPKAPASKAKAKAKAA